MFSFELVDPEGGEIKVTAWNETADMMADRLRKGGVYLVSKASLKPKNPK